MSPCLSFQWIVLREILQENPICNGKIYGFTMGSEEIMEHFWSLATSGGFLPSWLRWIYLVNNG